MNRLFIIPALLFTLIFCGGAVPSRRIPEFIDPTGTYTLTGSIKKHRVMGHSGELRVELLDSGKVAVSFYMNKGYPNYESGSFIDTLRYNEDMARYTPSCDSSCTMIFWFTDKAMELRGLYSNPTSGCGFASGVMRAAIFQKTSSDRPIIQDLSAHGVVH